MNEFLRKVRLPIIFSVVFLVLVNLVVFFLPIRHGAIFWIAYGFLMFVIVLQYGLAILCYRKIFIPEKGIAYYPIIRFGFIYLIVQAIVTSLSFVVNIFVSDSYFWVVLVVCIIILGIFGALIIATFASIKVVEHVEEDTKQAIQFIKSLTTDADILYKQTRNPELKEKLYKFYEKVRYSDPVSSDGLLEVESNIKEQFSLLKAAVSLDDVEKAEVILKKLLILMDERNQKCKLLKDRSVHGYL